ncbi:aromatic acid exporter family protein [Alkalihalobacillus sp. AL-G]|uniref:FUSC family protein n=1 Tax=Alkalihalobacillus sp. AL-G TaxID=2926399 RepID=UPI00272BF051|nr:aromatic acid exporter family protein [Alkalihalobacillus sp. AL-G]WLD92908.1 aromatic acid exporter family protein [Alkalihalobacillus sp. AL-G]
MKKLTIKKWIGSRVLKTGLAAFITALICNLFHLPVLFAVITAIVTVEPTASDSIKKGLIRFPAATIGAGFAMFFESFLGQSALAYALAATLTLAVCHKLRLDAGMLVATLTSVAMIAETEEHFVSSFFVRLLTTLIGLGVSTIINFMILPPHYMDMVQEQVNKLYERSGGILTRFVEGASPRQLQLEYQRLSKDMERSFNLAQFQREEWKYRRHNLSEIREFGILVKKLEYFQKILYHFGNLLSLDIEKTKLSSENVVIVSKAADSVAAVLQDPDHKMSEDHFELIGCLDLLFLHEQGRRERTDESTTKRHISQRLTIIYELLALQDALEDLERIGTKEGEPN